MKLARRFAIVGIAAFLTGAPAADVVAAESKTRAPTAPTPTSPAPMTQPVAAPNAAASRFDAIRVAPDLSSTIDAYTRGQAAEPGNLNLEKAYVRRVIELNAPQLAEAQARDLVTRDPSDGVALAVIGYMDARHGQSGEAAQTLDVAARLAPGDPFVMRTAAQIVAWYDTQIDRSQLTPRDVLAIGALRAGGANNAIYTAAYSTALALDRQQQAALTPMIGPSNEASLPQSPHAYSTPYAEPLYDYGPQPTQPNVNDYPDPYAYGPSYPWGWWGGGIIFDDFDFVHRAHDGHFDHDHDFAHDGRLGTASGFDRTRVVGGTTMARPAAPSSPFSPRPAPMRGGGFPGSPGFNGFHSMGNAGSFGGRGGGFPGGRGMGAGRAGGGGGRRQPRLNVDPLPASGQPDRFPALSTSDIAPTLSYRHMNDRHIRIRTTVLICAAVFAFLMTPSRAVSGEVLSTHPTTKPDWIGEALREADAVKDPELQSELCAEAAVLFARQGDVATYRQMIKRADMSLARASVQPKESPVREAKEAAAQSVIEALARAGDLTSAREMTEEAVAIKKESFRPVYLGSIASGRVKAGDLPGALRTADAVAPDHRGTVEWRIVAALAERGQFAEADRTVASMKHGSWEYRRALQSIAKAHATAGEFEAGLKVADQLPSASDRQEIFQTVAEVQAGQGDSTGARATAARTPLGEKHASPGHPPEEGRESAFAAVARAELKRHDIAGAIKTAALVEGALKPDLLKDIAMAQIQAGDLAGAQKTADAIGPPEEQPIGDPPAEQAHQALALARVSGAPQ